MSDTLRAAAQQALEALEEATTYTSSPSWSPSMTHECNAAVIALRAALAAAVAEPVASVTECEACFTPDVCQLRGTCDHYAAERLRVAAPPQREPYDQTALGLCNACGWKAVGPDGCLNCAPQREREPLTHDQVWNNDIIMGCNAAGGRSMDALMKFVRAIERAHGIAPASAPKEQA